MQMDINALKTNGQSALQRISGSLRHALRGILLAALCAAVAQGAGRDEAPLTPEERLWLAENQSRIVLAVETSYPPFVFIDSKDQPTGLAHDYMLLVESILGVHFKQRRFASLEDIFEKVRSGEAHIVNAVTKTPLRSAFLTFTEPFISVPNAIIVRNDRSGAMHEEDLSGLKVSLVRSYAVTEHLMQKGLGFTPNLTPDDLTALLNVSFGRSDAAVVDLATASYLISQKGITNLRVAGEAAFDIQLAIGTPIDEPVLHAVIQKGLAAITDEERETIRKRWINMSRPISILSDRRFWITLGSAASVVFAVIVAMLIWNRTLRRQVALRTQALNTEKEALRISEERLRIALEGASDGIWDWSIRTEKAYFSPRYYTMMGYEPNEFPASYENWKRLIHPDDWEHCEQTLHRAIDENAAFSVEFRFKAKDGEWRHILSRGKAAEIDSTGKAVRMAGSHTDITERKRAEETARESERYLRAIFQATPDGFWMMDGTGKATEANAAFCLMSGYTREELLSMNIADLDATEPPQEIAARIQRIMERGPEIFEARLRRKDGSSFDVEISSAFLDAGGGRLVCFGRDITENKRDKLALKEEALRRRTLMEQSMDGIVVVDQDGRVFETNSAFAHMLGYSMEEMASLGVWDWDAQMSRSELEEAVRVATASGGHFNSRHRRKDGSIYDVEITTTAVASEGRKLIMCVCRDVSERLRAEEALRESEKRLQRAEKVAHFGHWEFLLDTKQVRVSNGARTIYGLGEREWSIDEVRRIPLEQYRPMLDEALKGLLREGRDYSVEFKIRRPADGMVVDIHSIAEYSPARRAVFGVIQDITRRKQAEEQKEMLEIQLRQAQKLEAIGTLAGGIAHDFNNILSPIIGYTEMAMEDAPPFTPLKDYMEQVLKAAHRARDLVKQILAFSRQGQEQQRAPIDLNPIAGEALKLMRASLPTGIEIRQEIRQGMALADATQIHQVIVNLCANAAQAMGDKGALEVSLEPVEIRAEDLPAFSAPDVRPGPYLRLRVKDTGHGMDSSTIGRIFDPYFTTKEVGKGSGLGLAVVHGIVKRHEGAVRVQSRPGEGSVFDVYIPRIESAGEMEGALQSIVPGGVERILLVDDEPMVAKLEATILRRLGYQVTMKSSASEALAAFRSNPHDFDLVVTDYTMPHMTGTELSQEILRIRPDIRIILCTGYSERATESAARELGITGFAMKPLDRRQLAELVRRALDENRD